MARSFTAHPFSSEIVSLIGTPRVKAEEWIKKTFNVEVEIPHYAAAAAAHFVTGDGIHYVLIHSENFDAGSIAHECVHAASFVYLHAGATHDLENEEPYAYLVQRIFETCMGEAHGRRNRSRKKTAR